MLGYPVETKSLATQARNAAKDEAARLLADPNNTVKGVAAQLKLSEMTIQRWKREPDFQSAVMAHIAEWRERVQREGIADRLRRVEAQAKRHSKLQRIEQARAEAAAKDPNAAPGADTGLLAKRIKSIGSGEQQQIIEEWTLDEALLKEARALEEAVAIELGQRVQQIEVSRRDLSEEKLLAMLEQQMALLPEGERADLAVECNQIRARLTKPGSDE